MGDIPAAGSFKKENSKSSVNRRSQRCFFLFFAVDSPKMPAYNPVNKPRISRRHGIRYRGADPARSGGYCRKSIRGHARGVEKQISGSGLPAGWICRGFSRILDEQDIDSDRLKNHLIIVVRK
jgi:hypothetical protein